MKTLRILGKERILLPLENVVLLEAKNNYTMIHADDGSSFLSSRNLGMFEQKIPEFLRLNKTYLINQNFVQKIENKIIHLKNGFSIAPSRRRKNEVLSNLNSFLY
ncbi:LytR/AlgR family response regulator transcription factor [Emticicia agri]|uniref:LytTR family transcriptional regulator n=1 Tax=Emticicia agri TaxID=2492393 RepID=A0A4Q5M215_9BACT|nr:LytTR family DNA-binding domain-containing protein [Emticicia agri]RYU95893.1 LytTR family transcriptional regulator [Emticicia agri]